MIVAINELDPRIDALVTLAAEIWHQHYDGFLEAGQVKYMLGRFQSRSAIVDQICSGTQYYLITSEGQNIGYFAIKPENGSLFLSKFYMKASERGKGHGRRAMEFIKDQAKLLGLSMIRLTVNRNNKVSIAVYGRLGFMQTGNIVTHIGHGFVMDDYMMEQPIGLPSSAPAIRRT